MATQCNSRKLFRRTFGLYRRYLVDRSSANMEHMVSAGRVFETASTQTGMDPVLATKLFKRCFMDTTTMDQRLYNLSDHINGCLMAVSA